jgi:hypothetical protein
MEMQENTSGQGSSAMVPAEVRGGWNWGAFWLSWIWSIGNQVWIGLLASVPCIQLIMMFVLAVKGNEWAWQYRRWESVEQFKKVQGTWAMWGWIILAIYIVMTFLSILALIAIGVIAAISDTGHY